LRIQRGETIVCRPRYARMGNLSKKQTNQQTHVLITRGHPGDHHVNVTLQSTNSSRASSLRIELVALQHRMCQHDGIQHLTCSSLLSSTASVAVTGLSTFSILQITMCSDCLVLINDPLTFGVLDLHKYF
jgi:hypothetical protein